ncbi:MAG TPA: hypothetical protein DDZ51_25195 [Planctomycetaceae bacterium]|nr:hypothetical protein [Planctomycetaceae bacterium]
MGSSAALLSRYSRLSSPLTVAATLAAVVACTLAPPSAHAQIGGGFGGQRAVGGVVIDANGVLRSATLDQRQASLKEMRQSIAQPQGDLAEPAELRMISLAKLQQAMEESAASGKPLSDDMRHLAGIQRIEYVFVYPDRNDIVLAGPAEPWIVRDDASVVGVNSGRPVLKLDDLIVALRSVEPARTEGITCSIEPTEEGRVRLQTLLKRVTLRPGQNPATFEPAMREAFGPQMIKLTGVPSTSHYARTLVAADYQMKRLAMALEDSPVNGLPSYLTISRNQKHSSQSNPRWWMACNYDALSHSDDKLAWRISGQGVKTLTETDLITADGKAQPGQKADKSATLWAETMTQRFDDLSKAQAVFGELRNCFDLSVVATLIVQEQLAQRANCDLAHLMGNSGEIKLDQFSIPKSVEPQCSFVRGASGWVVTASGGVDVNAFEVVQTQQVDPTLAGIRTGAAESVESQSWWWNG